MTPRPLVAGEQFDIGAIEKTLDAVIHLVGLTARLPPRRHHHRMDIAA